MRRNNHGTPGDDRPVQTSRGFRQVLTTFRRWWAVEVIGTVDQPAVIDERKEEGGLTGRYLLMISMSAGIAILGLLLSSPAVVIGAMLLSPLMGPIMGVGFALATGDSHWLRHSARNLTIGVVFAIAFCALVVFASPLQTVTTEIAARTRPNLFDLLVAIFSAIAGGYAVIRGREGTIVGVAIATALMPPIAVIGFGIATVNWTVLWGALLLFVTNLTAIALVATLMARLYGFSANLSEKQTQMQSLLIAGAFVALAVPLGLALIRIGWETNATRQINTVVLEVFEGRARISELSPDYQSTPIRVSTTVLTPRIIGTAERLAASEIRRRLGEPVELSLTQVRIGTSAQAAEEAQLAAVREREEAALEQGEAIADRLALLAGVTQEEVTVDLQRRRAVVTALPLEGAALGAYAQLERRIAVLEPEWDIRLLPPLRRLPDITFEAGEPEGTMVPSNNGRRALAVAAWAHSRVGVPLRISGPADAVEAVRAALVGRDVAVETLPVGKGYGNVSLSWAAGEEE